MIKRLLVPVDGSELAARAIHASIELAQQLGASITAFVAEQPAPAPMPGQGGGRYLRDLEQHNIARADHAGEVLGDFGRRAAEAGVPFEGVFAQTQEVDVAIVDTARDKGCDLIVMVTHGRGTFGELLFGSHTKAVMARSKLPLLVVH
jgi:nucleotide-binding universal stress UspA family protein